jgi:subtilisin-like proprotein convertase family protein
MGATISNNSWTSSVYDAMLEAGIRNAGLVGHIYVAAAGNSGKNIDTNKVYPASYNLDNVIAVAGLDSNNRLTNWSNFGNTVDIAAPGASIYSTLPGNRYGYLSGTSMATPFVTGAIALVRDLNPNWSASQVIQQVVSTADKLPTITKIPGGRLNLGKALLTSTPPDPGPPPPADVLGAWVTGIAAISGNNRLTGIRVSFSEAISGSSFDLSDIVQLSGPAGSITPTAIQPVAGSTTQFDVLFAPQSQTGSYVITLGTDILDLAGNPLNQNNNGINGEVPGDYFSGSVNYTATNQYSGANMPGSIIDFSVNQYPLTVPDATLIGGMQVQINLSHGWMSDLVIKLRSPQGTEILLANRRGGGGKGYNNTIFDSSATKSILQGTGLFAGTFRPEQSLTAFQGQSTQGTWYLIIEDKVRGDSGTLHNWSITFTGSAGSSSFSPAINKGVTDLVQGLLQRIRKFALQPVASVKPNNNQGAIAIVHQPGRQLSEIPLVKRKIQQQQQQLLKTWEIELQQLKRQW